MAGSYVIPISGLKEGRRQFDFEINREFFEEFEESEIMNGALTAFVEADKVPTHIDLTIKIAGTVIIPCDRCLGEFAHNVSCENRLLVKFGKAIDESDPDIVTIPADENELDLRQYFYEYILLALPIQKVHPDNAVGNSTCDPEMLKKLEEHIINQENRHDPRWDELKKLINNN
ncbi:MAG: DUF177 domain-containing protein [Bacteroidales bacterium]|jgi:uncharacterized metal-binding protein YceD (DUF177 family)